MAMPTGIPCSVAMVMITCTAMLALTTCMVALGTISYMGMSGMALPEFLTLYSQLLSGEAPWLHEPRILLRSAFAGAGFDAVGAVVDLMGGDGQEQPDVELLAPLPPRVQ